VAPRFVKKNSGSLLHATELVDTLVGSAKFSALFILANLRSIHYRYDVVFSDGTREIIKSGLEGVATNNIMAYYNFDLKLLGKI
jgi:hypothetical protein